MSEQFMYKPFSEIDLGDCFFDSLKKDYLEFSDWFNKKAVANESAFIQLVNGNLEGFLYLKEEKGPIQDIQPNLDVKSAIKIGTFKINPHGTRLGERFIKKSLDYALSKGISILYVTIFSHHDYLLNIFKKFGFYIQGSKETINGIENVLVKDFDIIENDILLDYPLVNSNSRAFLLAIKPEYHTRLFPDSKLFNEKFNIIKDVSHSNSVCKIYIGRMYDMRKISPLDNLIIYRTTDISGQAEHRAVATTICTVEDVATTKSFLTYDDFKKYCKNYSVYSDSELTEFYNDIKTSYIIKMTYNVSLSKRIIRKTLINDIGIIRDQYWGVIPLTKYQFNEIIDFGEVNKGYIIY